MERGKKTKGGKEAEEEIKTVEMTHYKNHKIHLLISYLFIP